MATINASTGTSVIRGKMLYETENVGPLQKERGDLAGFVIFGFGLVFWFGGFFACLVFGFLFGWLVFVWVGGFWWLFLFDVFKTNLREKAQTAVWYVNVVV